HLHAPFGAHRSGLFLSVSRQSPHACHSTGAQACQPRSGIRMKSSQTSGRELETTSAPADRTSFAWSAEVTKPVPQTGAVVVWRIVVITWGTATAGAMAIAYGAGETILLSPVSSPVASRAWIRCTVRSRTRLAWRRK